MPPRRRQNRSPDPASPTPDRDQSPADEFDDASPIPFYNTTFSAHRVSPLYLGKEQLTPDRLQTIAQRLRDRLVGDVVRGVEVGLGPGGGNWGLARAGALERVEMRWVGVADLLDVAREELESWDADDDGTAAWRRATGELLGKRALQVSMHYELASCTALLLPSLTGEGKDRTDARGKTQFFIGAGTDHGGAGQQLVDPDRFLTLPLLLLRMPAPLKTVVADFLSTTFDCRVSPMRLGTRSLVGSWEAWIRSAGLPARGPLAKDVVLSLGFHVPPPPDKATIAPGQPSGDGDATASAHHHLGIKSVDVIIPAAELRRFTVAGQQMTGNHHKRPASTEWGWQDDLRKRRRLAGRLYEEGWEWRGASCDGDGDGDGDGHARPGQQPFTEALACYLDEHLGLHLFHPGVRIVKIACGGFVMSESRLKMFAPAGPGPVEDGTPSLLGQRGAVWELLGGLVGKAQVQAAVG